MVLSARVISIWRNQESRSLEQKKASGLWVRVRKFADLQLHEDVSQVSTGENFLKSGSIFSKRLLADSEVNL